MSVPTYVDVVEGTEPVQVANGTDENGNPKYSTV
jgi:hypothetical protein